VPSPLRWRRNPSIVAFSVQERHDSWNCIPRPLTTTSTEFIVIPHLNWGNENPTMLNVPLMIGVYDYFGHLKNGVNCFPYRQSTLQPFGDVPTFGHHMANKHMVNLTPLASYGESFHRHNWHLSIEASPNLSDCAAVSSNVILCLAIQRLLFTARRESYEPANAEYGESHSRLNLVCLELTK
jgi:hypothetical protein